MSATASTKKGLTITLTFSGAVNPATAANAANYTLTAPAKKPKGKHKPTPPPTPVGFVHRGFEPRLEQCQDVTVADATGHRFQKLRVRDTIEIPAQIRIHHFRVAAAE